MKKGLVSVVMSSYNTDSRYLLCSVNSILNQTYRKIELLVIIDGGDYDGCLSRIDDHRLKVIMHKRSLGLAARLNEGINMANGEYVARMDSDDYALPCRLDKQVEFLTKHPYIDICSMFAKRFGDSKKIMLSVYTDDSYICPKLFFGNMIVHPTVMIRKRAIEKNNIKYDEKYRCAQDYELWTRLVGKCSFSIIPAIGLLYRTHYNQISVNRKKEQDTYVNNIIIRNMSYLGLGNNDLPRLKMLCNDVPVGQVKQRDLCMNALMQIKQSIYIIIRR